MVRFLTCIIFSAFTYQFSNSQCFSQAAHNQEISDLLYVKNFIDSIYSKCPASTNNYDIMTTTFEPTSNFCQNNSDCIYNSICCDRQCKSKTSILKDILF